MKEVVGWGLVVVGVLIGAFGFWVISQSGNRPDWMGSVGAGIGLIAGGAAVATAGLRIAGVIATPVENPWKCCI